MKTVTKSVRCAIYTRKSSDQGLEQDFNLLDAQAPMLKPQLSGWSFAFRSQR
jgi:hypothetical protein